MAPYEKTKDEMMSSTLTFAELKRIAFSFNKTIPRNADKIHGVGEFKVENKQALVDLIWNAWGGDDGWEKHKTSLPNQYTIAQTVYSKQKDTPEKNITIENRLTEDKAPYSSSDDEARPVSTVQKTKVKSKSKAKSKSKSKSKSKANPNISTLEFDFTDTDIMLELNVRLKKYTHDTIEPPDADDISPKELINLINTDKFCVEVAKSLKDIYDAKLKKYKKLQETTAQSITNDTNKKNKLIVTKHVDDQELDNLFPMIAINTSFLIKLRTLGDLALKKSKEYSHPSDRKVIDLVRKNLLLSITDKDDGILSLTGASRVKIRNHLCKTLYILSKGFRPFMDAFLNLVFTGPTGVEKTKLAETYGFVLENSGILLRGDVVVASQKHMVGEYVGHTAIKSVDVLMKAMEGLILVDESYQIMPCDKGKVDKESKSFSPEAITEIVNFLDKYVGMTIMIVAGYEREMDGCFFGTNEGLNRVFSNCKTNPQYSNSDLLTILINRVNRKIGEDIFNDEIVKYIFTIIVKLSQTDTNIFVNQAGDILNLSSMFLNSYYGSIKSSWGNMKDDVLIVNSAFNQFLRNKGYSLHIN